MMHFTNRSLERKLTLRIYERNTSWRKRAYCWCTTPKMTESKEKEVQEEACLIEKGWLHHNEKLLVLPHFILSKSATMDAYTSCFSQDESTDKFFSSFHPVLHSGSSALSTWGPAAFQQLRADFQAHLCHASGWRSLLEHREMHSTSP